MGIAATVRPRSEGIPSSSGRRPAVPASSATWTSAGNGPDRGCGLAIVDGGRDWNGESKLRELLVQVCSALF